MTICHAKQEDEKELVFKFGFVGEFVPRKKTSVFLCAFSLTRLRAGAPSRREPWGAGQNHLSGNGFPRGKG